MKLFSAGEGACKRVKSNTNYYILSKSEWVWLYGNFLDAAPIMSTHKYLTILEFII